MSTVCVHAGDVIDPGPPGPGCEVCLAEGGTWHHLRQCLGCGRTLCCDSSPSQHMSRHREATGHPVMRSAQPGEDWVWCQPDEAMIREVSGRWETYDPFVAAGTWFAGRHLEAGGVLPLAGDLVTSEGFPLGEWLEHVLALRAAGELDAPDAAAIEALPGWTWDGAAAGASA